MKLVASEEKARNSNCDSIIESSSLREADELPQFLQTKILRTLKTQPLTHYEENLPWKFPHSQNRLDVSHSMNWRRRAFNVVSRRRRVFWSKPLKLSYGA